MLPSRCPFVRHSCCITPRTDDLDHTTEHSCITGLVPVQMSDGQVRLVRPGTPLLPGMTQIQPGIGPHGQGLMQLPPGLVPIRGLTPVSVLSCLPVCPLMMLNKYYCHCQLLEGKALYMSDTHYVS